MFKLTHKLPDKYWVVCSGGIDSMSVLHFLNKPSSRDKLLGVIHVNHHTGAYSEKAEKFVVDYCKKNNIHILVGDIKGEPLSGSKEEFWREARYAIFDKVPDGHPIILAHNFDDCLEEYIMCTMVRGFRGTIPYQRGRCIRPFRLWKRTDIENYTERYDVEYVEDPTNKNTM